MSDSRLPSVANESNGEKNSLLDENKESSGDDWRNGPAKYWYDFIDLPQDCHQYDYGFKLKTNSLDNSIHCESVRSRIDSEDAFHLVSQTNWEKDVIWNADHVRHQVLKLIDKTSIAGWIPVEDNRKAPNFVKKLKITNDSNNNSNNSVVINDNIICDNNKNSNSCIKNSSRKLRNRKSLNCYKVDAIRVSHSIKDTQQSYEWVTSLPEENKELVVNRWEDAVIWDSDAMDTIPEPKVIPFHPSDDCLIFSRVLSEDTNDSSQTGDAFKTLVNNFNISNDEFYASISKADNNSSIYVYIQHSIPALTLHPMYFPTCVRDHNHFYRPLLKKSKILISKKQHNVLLCHKLIKQKEIKCESESHTLTDLSHFLIKSPKDLTACDGDIVLMEYSEEDPPLLMRNGMGSKIINYFKKKTVGDTSPVKNYTYGEAKQVTNSPFIGDLSPGQSQQAIETNMFRAPIFEHTFPETDFLVIRTRDSYFVRSIGALYVVGQELPLIEVPRPRSKTWFEFIKRFAKIAIYRLFQNRKCIKNLSSELKNAFPHMSQHMISSCLSESSERQNDYYVWKGEMPSEEQINSLVSPEECCAYYSSAIAQQKLKEIGYGDRLYLFNEDKDEENGNCLDEVAIAPWNTTLAYIATLNSKKWLNVTEYNEDASLVYSVKSYKDFKDQMPSIKRCQPVSDKALKRMTLKNAQQWLINYGMAAEKVKKLKNQFECIHLIKELSEKLKQNGVTSMSKMSTTEQHYRFECQKIFDLQTSIYSSKENFESDEEETDEEYDSEIEDMGHYLEAMLTQNKTFEEIDYEREEEERLDFVKSLQENNNNLQNGKCKESYVGKILKITRTFQNEGKTYTRTEFVRQSEVIEAYVRIRTTKSDDFIRKLSLIGNHAENDNKALNKSKTWNKSKANSSLKLVNENTKSVKRVLNNSNKVISNNHLNNSNFSNCNHEEIFNDENEGHVRVDGSKLRFSKKVIDDAIRIQMEEKQKEMEEREALKTDFNNVEYLTRRRSQRCRIDPMVKLKDIFDKTILEARKLPEIINNIDYFMAPVKEKEVPDYYLHIKNPMDLKTMREKIYDGMYSSRREFLEDIQLIYSNSAEYNGIDHQITKDAKILLEFCVKKFAHFDDELSRLENEINPILANDDSYQLAFIFDSVIAVFKQVRDIEYFFDISLRSQYRRKATKVIDLNMIAKKSKEKKYRSIDEFMNDLKLLQQNTTESYGSDHELSEIATNQILLIAQTTIDQFLEKFKTHFPNMFKNHSSFKSS